MTYESNNSENEKYSQRRITLEDNNPWLQDRTPSDLSRQSEMLSNHYVEHHLRGEPNGQYSTKIERELEAFYSVRDPTLKRYTIRRIAGHPKTKSVTTDFTSNEYFITYNRD
jgi:hypothetical protein